MPTLPDVGAHTPPRARGVPAPAERPSAALVTIVPSLSMTHFLSTGSSMCPFLGQMRPASRIYRNPGLSSKAREAEWETRLDFLASTHEPLSATSGGPPPSPTGVGSPPGAVTRMRHIRRGSDPREPGTTD